MDLATEVTPLARRVRPSKRVNARLQLAAALIEADNAEIEERNKRERLRYEALQAQDHAIGPPPPLTARLASESVIFLPYQLHHEGVQSQSIAGAGLDAEGRPIIDYLDVKLPTEKRFSHVDPTDGLVGGRQRRSLSVTSLGRASPEWHSRPTSLTGGTLASRPVSMSRHRSQDDELGEEEQLSEWGVDKFFTSEMRQRIESGKQSRATSMVGVERPQSVMSDSYVAGRRAQSEVGTPAASPSVPVSALGESKLDLLAKIKMYREGQRDVNDQTHGEDSSIYRRMQSSSPPPDNPVSSTSVDSQRLSGHLKALTLADGSSIGVVWHARNPVMGQGSDELEWRQSKAGVMGDCWSEQGDGSENRSTCTGAPHNGDKQEQTSTVDSKPSMRICVESDESKWREDDMAGVGSFSRTPPLRRDSIASSSYFLGAPPLGAESGPGSPGWAQSVVIRPQSAFMSPPRASPGPLEEQQSGNLLSLGSVPPRPQSAGLMRPSMLNPAFSPRLRPQSEALLAAIDPFPAFASDLGPYPTIGALGSRMAPPTDSSKTVSAHERSRRHSESMATASAMHSFSTRQLQELAKHSTFPASFGMDSAALAGLPDEDAELLEAEMQVFLAEGHGDTFAPVDEASRLAESDIPGKTGMQRPLESFFGANQEPDLSSARWGRKKRKSLLANRIKSSLFSNSMAGDVKHALANNDEVDDEYTSPPTRGPLRPQGMQNRLPKAIRLPKPLAGTSLAPRLRLIDVEKAQEAGAWDVPGRRHAPLGFVLHNRSETLPMKSLQVQGANGAKPFFMSPEGMQKHDHLVSEFLKSQSARRVIQVPCIAPSGIGRRASMSTTALFRNQLVQHDDEKEGWGWEAGSRIGTELAVNDDEEEDISDRGEAEVAAGKRSKRERKSEKKMLKEKRKRQEARRVRRRKRELARSKNVPFDQVGVEELSPDEDLDLSETSSDESASSVGASGSGSERKGNSIDEERWLDENRPAGQLYGKSLLDVLDERKTKVASKTRQYGQVQLEAGQDGDEKSIRAASIGAAEFRDNPVGFNDTRERMEAVFGPDQIWASEMAKRKLQDAKEEEEALVAQMARDELQAEELARKGRKRGNKKSETKKAKAEMGDETLPTMAQLPCEDWMSHHTPSVERSVTPVDPPVLELGLPLDSPASKKLSSFANVAAPWLEKSDEEGSSSESSSDDSEAAAERRKGALQRARMSRSLGGQGLWMAEHLLRQDDDDSSDKDDDVPLSQIRGKFPSATFASQVRYPSAQSDGEEEEVPLAQLVAKRKKKKQSIGMPDLRFHIGDASSPPEHRGGDEDEDDEPLGRKLVDPDATLTALSALQRSPREPNGGDDDDDDDDRPLGIAHPQAAIIAEQATVIKQLQRELMTKAYPPVFAMLPHPQSYQPHMAGACFTGPATPLAVPSLPAPGVSIASWAAHVPPDATASDSDPK